MLAEKKNTELEKKKITEDTNTLDDYKHIEEKSVVDKVVDTIVNQIIHGELAPGDKLLTEMELCEKTGAGRNSVREAVKKLQAYGIVYIRRADGTYVSENYNQKMLDPMLYNLILQKNSWKDFVELRSVIDIGILHLIVQRKDITKLIPKLYGMIGQMSAELHSENPSVEKVLEFDMGFHTLIAEAGDNPMLGTIMEYITRLTLPSRYQTTEKVIKSGEIAEFIQLHMQIVSVIENCQSEKIVETVQNHYVYWK